MTPDTIKRLKNYADDLQDGCILSEKQGVQVGADLRALIESYEAVREALKPFADKADKWEANHPTGKYPNRDSAQVSHRLGDFRNARAALASTEGKGTGLHTPMSRRLLKEGVLSSDPEVMRGQLCFAGTRIPITSLRSFIVEGYSDEQILKEYPTLTADQVRIAREWTFEGKDRRPLRERLAAYYTDEEAKRWLSAPHPQLNGDTPQEVLDRGDAETVHAILDRLDSDIYL